MKSLHGKKWLPMSISWWRHRTGAIRKKPSFEFWFLLGSRLRVLTFDVQKDGTALHFVVVVGDAVAHPATVVTSGLLLDPLQDQDVGVVDAG